MKNLMKFSIVLLLLSAILRADIHSDLQNLSTQGNTLSTELSAFTFNQESSCMKLGTLNRSIEAYTAAIKSTTEAMTSFSVTEADLTVLDTLSLLARNMGTESLRLTAELNSIEDVAELFEYRAGLSAMLQLSRDIGTMADRILEMSDRILIMANNIGVMANRILITQQIQNSNIALTQASILTTQQNMVLLSDSLSSITYNLTLGQIVSDTDTLAGALNATNLNNDNMDSELASLETQTSALLVKTTNLLLMVIENSKNMSHYINSDTLTMLGDISAANKALALSLETYARTIEQLAPLTQTPVLSAATASMLQLTKDIGVMSDRIMEMTKDISIMADNIGLMADNIVATQDIQTNNILFTEASLLTSQSIMINVIKNFGL